MYKGIGMEALLLIVRMFWTRLLLVTRDILDYKRD
jgi:hypothetical protein